MLQLDQYNDLITFKSAVTLYLEQDEIINNLALGLLLAVKNEIPLKMATVIREDKMILVLFQTSPKQIIISKAEELTSDEITQLARLLDESFSDIPGFIGEKNLVNQLSKEMTILRRLIPNMKMNQRIYKLDQVKKKADSSGKLVKLEVTNLPIIQEWTYQFCIDIDEKMSKVEAKAKAIDMIERGRLYGWEVDGELVSMANASRPTKTNITVNFVFTPLEERKKGFASSCVSALSEQLLNNGYKTTSLYTDLDNPTSNKIYMEIGYEPIVDSIVIHFG